MLSRCDSLDIGYIRKKKLGSGSRIIENNVFSFGQIYDHTIAVSLVNYDIR